MVFNRPFMVICWVYYMSFPVSLQGFYRFQLPQPYAQQEKGTPGETGGSSYAGIALCSSRNT
jgi:hypothetical protein